MTIKQHGGIFGRNPTFNDVTIEGQLTFEGNIDIDSDITWEDNKKALFGNDGDLQIYHDGSHSYVSDQGTGNLRLLAENFQVKNATDTEAMIVAVPNAGVSLYYNNLAKLTTASSGVSFDGNVIMNSGNGIDFSATSGTGTSELFDDYEEGTFTVSATRITDLTTNVGRYTKVGNLVTCEINLDWTATDNSGNDVIFTGLPFTTATGTHASIGPALVYGTDINTDVGAAIVLHIDDNQTRFYLVKAMDSSFAPLNAADMNSATTLRSTFTYTAA